MKSLSGLLRSQVVDAEERAEMLERVICYLHKMNFLQYFHVLQLFEVGNLLHQVQQVAFGEHFSINLTLERDSHQNTAAFWAWLPRMPLSRFDFKHSNRMYPTSMPLLQPITRECSLSSCSGCPCLQEEHE